MLPPLQEPHCDVLKLMGRKGFVRVAVEAGADIVPVYHFGNSSLFWFGPKLAALERLGRR